MATEGCHQPPVASKMTIKGRLNQPLMLSRENYWLTQPENFNETAWVLLIAVPVIVPHPDASGDGAGSAEMPHPPLSRSLSWVPPGFFADIPITCLQVVPMMLIVSLEEPSLEAKSMVPSAKLQLGFGPLPTVGSVAGLMPLSIVKKTFETVNLRLPTTTGEVSVRHEQLPLSQ
jgi:hypothetical protein